MKNVPAYMILSKRDLQKLLASFTPDAPDSSCMSVSLIVLGDSKLVSDGFRQAKVDCVTVCNPDVDAALAPKLAKSPAWASTDAAIESMQFQPSV